MKALNNMKFVAEASVKLNYWIGEIEAADDFADAKKNEAAAIGYIDCMITYLNCMIDTENNDFTESLDELLDEWSAEVYQKLANMAIKCGQPSDVVAAILKERDNHK